MAGPLHVELVSADRHVWAGDADIVIARTVAGDLGVQPGHQPLLGLLVDGVVEVRTVDGEEQIAAVHGGFLSVADDRVSILAEHAELATEIDLQKARQDLERAQAAGEDDTEAMEALRASETRVRAAERAA